MELHPSAITVFPLGFDDNKILPDSASEVLDIAKIWNFLFLNWLGVGEKAAVGGRGGLLGWALCEMGTMRDGHHEKGIP